MEHQILIHCSVQELRTIIREELQSMISELKEDRMLSPKQVAEKLDVSLYTVRHLTKKGYLIDHGTGRPKYKLSEVMKWKEKNK